MPKTLVLKMLDDEHCDQQPWCWFGLQIRFPNSMHFCLAAFQRNVHLVKLIVSEWLFFRHTWTSQFFCGKQVRCQFDMPCCCMSSWISLVFSDLPIKLKDFKLEVTSKTKCIKLQCHIYSYQYWFGRTVVGGYPINSRDETKLNFHVQKIPQKKKLVSLHSFVTKAFSSFPWAKKTTHAETTTNQQDLFRRLENFREFAEALAWETQTKSRGWWWPKTKSCGWWFLEVFDQVICWVGGPLPGCNRHHQDDITFLGSGIPN